MINAVRSKNAHKANLISAVTAVFTILSVTFPNTALAHLKEPLGTEIAATPLPGRTLTHSEYNYGEGKHEGEHTCCHGLALEFELGVTQEGGCSRARRGRGGLRPEAPLLR
jgi:hypothetical protein